MITESQIYSHCVDAESLERMYYYCRLSLGKVMKILCFNPNEDSVCVCFYRCLRVLCLALFSLWFVSLFKCSHRLSVDINRICHCSSIHQLLFTVVCKLIWPTKIFEGLEELLKKWKIYNYKWITVSFSAGLLKNNLLSLV